MDKIGSFANSFSSFLRGDESTTPSEQPRDPLASTFAEIEHLKRLFFRSPSREKVRNSRKKTDTEMKFAGVESS
jgi:hypothetical protein